MGLHNFVRVLDELINGGAYVRGYYKANKKTFRVELATAVLTKNLFFLAGF